MKVLIISHNALSKHNNMGKTLASFFYAFKKEELCQLYVYPAAPDVDMCQSFYEITDVDVRNSYFCFKVKGRETKPVNSFEPSFKNKNQEKTYRNLKNERPLRKILRDLMWRYARWYNKELKEWINKEKPTCIFVAPGQAKFIYDVALKISKEFAIPIVTYIFDEYYFVKKPQGFLNRIYQKSLSKKIEELLKKSKSLVTICEEARELYSKHFHIPATTIMTGGTFSIAEKEKARPSINTLCYFGNIRLNRYKSLAEIGQALQEINEEYHTAYRLDIYSGEQEQSILEELRKVQAIRVCGYVTGKEFQNAFENAEVFVHTEAFDEESIDKTKHSVSTKLADALGSGTPLFAYGPENIASIRHLQRNKCAVVCAEKARLKEALLEVLQNTETRIHVSQKGLLTAQEYHNADKQSKKIRTLL